MRHFIEKIKKIVVFLLMIVYLPVVLGGGECIGICFDTVKGIELDFSHRCGKAIEGTPVSGLPEMIHIQDHHTDTCRDFPLYTGDGSLFNDIVKYIPDHINILTGFYLTCSHLQISEIYSLAHVKTSNNKKLPVNSALIPSSSVLII